MTTLLFYLFSLITIISAVCVVSTKNPVHAVLFLILAFFNIAGLWILLSAEFLALMLIMIYVGAVMVLFLFVIMMINLDSVTLRKAFKANLPFGSIIGIILVIEMSIVLYRYTHFSDTVPVISTESISNTKQIGALLFSDYIYPVEIASVILLVALIAAVVLTLRDRRDKKLQSPHRQVKVSAAERLKLVKMNPDLKYSSPTLERTHQDD